MKLALIVAIARNGVIGRDNTLPWHLPEDLRHFKAMTLGKPLVMGRRTWESIGRPLPGRTSIVVSRSAALKVPEGVVVVASLDAALQAAQRLAARDGVDECMVIGGADIYRAALPLATRIYLTRIDSDIPGDTWFPALDATAWHERELGAGTGSGAEALPYRFSVLERIGPPTTWSDAA